MTILDKATLQALWINGFIPQSSDYSNWIQSQVNTAETSAQTLAGSLQVTKLITNSISASNVVLGGNTFNVNIAGAATISAGGNININSTGGTVTVSAASNFNVATGNSVSIQGGDFASGQGSEITLSTNANLLSPNSIFLSANTNVGIGATNNITLSPLNNLSLNGNVTFDKVILSAAGTTQATAALVSASVTVCKGVADGQTTGFRLMANKTGRAQYLFSDTVSANLWPPTGGTINGLGANAAFALGASTLYTVMHISNSAYGVK